LFPPFAAHSAFLLSAGSSLTAWRLSNKAAAPADLPATFTASQANSNWTASAACVADEGKSANMSGVTLYFSGATNDGLIGVAAAGCKVWFVDPATACGTRTPVWYGVYPPVTGELTEATMGTWRDSPTSVETYGCPPASAMEKVVENPAQPCLKVILQKIAGAASYSVVGVVLGSSSDEYQFYTRERPACRTAAPAPPAKDSDPDSSSEDRQTRLIVMLVLLCLFAIGVIAVLVWRRFQKPVGIQDTLVELQRQRAHRWAKTGEKRPHILKSLKELDRELQKEKRQQAVAGSSESESESESNSSSSEEEKKEESSSSSERPGESDSDSSTVGESSSDESSSESSIEVATKKVKKDAKSRKKD
jgi:hypothetical protein